MPRNTRLFRPRDELDALLAEALSHQLNRCRGKGTVSRVKAIEAEVHSSFANPDNWEDRGVVCIIYLDERTREEITIGKFQERIHKRTGARKLSRINSDIPLRCVTPGCCDNAAFNTEVFTDPVLVYGPPVYCPPIPPQNQYERQAIRDYLARTKEVTLDEFFGKISADKLLAQLKDME